MIERGHPVLSIGAQCRLLAIAQSSFYHSPQGETETNLALTRRVDEEFLETPLSGVRQMTWDLRNQGHSVNDKRVRRLMRLMGVRRDNHPPDRCLILLAADDEKPNTIRPTKGHKTTRDPLRDLRVDRPSRDRSRRHHHPADATRSPLSSDQWRTAARSSIWSLSRTGPLARSWPGASPTPWRLTVSRRGPDRGHPPLRDAGDHEHGRGHSSRPSSEPAA